MPRRRPGRRPAVTWVLLGFVALVAAACTDAEPTPGVRSDATLAPATSAVTVPVEALPEAPEPAPAQWEPCGGGVECATVEVPLDYAEPTGRRIELALARRPARSDDRLGALVVNPGGPGGSAVDLVRADPLPVSVTDRFDLVGFDPRGVGASTPLACARDHADFLALDPEPDDPAEQQALEQAARAMADECAAADGELLAHLDTTHTARDLDQVRRAIGEDQVSYLGFSYGTLIGLEYARLFPDRLRALVLDGVVPPTMTLEEMLAGQASTMEANLGDLTDLYDRVAARVEEAPLPTRLDGRTAGPDDVVLALIASAYPTDGNERLRTALERADDGDGTALVTLGDTYVATSDNFGAYVGVMCTDGPRPGDATEWSAMADRLAAVAPRVGAAAANELLACAFWPVDQTRTPSEVSPPGLVPALVIGTTGDGATPYDDARAVAAQLPGAALLTYDGDGHTATTRDRCVAGVVTRYLHDLELPEPGAVCPS